MSFALQIASAAILAGVIIGAMVGWCIAAWRNRIDYGPREDEEPYGEANTYRRERL